MIKKIELNNTHIIKKSIFQEFKKVAIEVQYYWRHEDSLIGWSDSNNYKFGWVDADVRIELLTFDNGTETYQVYINNDFIACDLIELSVDDTDLSNIVVYCKLIILWD